MTGRTMTWWQKQPRDRLQRYRCLKLGIRWPREILYSRINERVREMFDAGFVAEVEMLLERYPRSCQAFKAIGYRQIVSSLEGSSTPAQAIEETSRESRRYAKRQTTWFRSDPEITWLDGMGWDQVAGRASGLIDGFLAAGG
jgi:tRNA dimethylallyltransferase